MADCIQALVTANIKAALANIAEPSYKNTVAAVEEERRFLQINNRYPFVLILEDEPRIGDYQTIDRLEYDLWWFPSWCDRIEGIEVSDQDKEMAHYLRNVMADEAKALDVDFHRGGYGEKTELLNGTYDLYEAPDCLLLGIWSKVFVETSIDITNPYRLR